MAEINGTPGPDTINGTAGNDTINAGDGNDTLTGGEGDDIINGEGGDDYITGFWVSGFDIINGGAGNDILWTNDGTDTLNGGDGNDTIQFSYRFGAPEGGIANGGAGDDLIRLDARNITSIDGGSGIDTLSFEFPYLSGIGGLGRDFDLTALWSGGVGTINGTGTITGIELLGPGVVGTNFNDIMIIGAGYLQALIILGASGNDQIIGGSGDDRIETGPGTSIVQGGAGNDTILGGNLTDNLSGDNGDDFIFGADDADILNGGAGNDRLVGGVGADFLTGGSGDDILTGGGGPINGTQDGIPDTMIGGTGNDVYDVNSSGDMVTELVGEGDDEVRATLAVYVLAANVERLTYTGGSARFAGIGNALDNVIVGSIGRDELYGNDGNDALYDIGANAGQGDYLAGGAGNDSYYVSNRETSTGEAANGGIDTVFTDVSIYGLQANIENLTANGNATHEALVGNILDNVITGGTGVDVLFGREGNDTLVGGSGTANTVFGQEGDDIYIVTALGDTVVEFAGQGSDTVQASVASFTLAANVENLTFTGAGTARIGVGNDLANLIRGLGGDDSLNGLGGDDVIIAGSGADLLQGGSGADQFRYEGGETGMDRILDFLSGTDKIALRSTFFTPTATVSFVSGVGAVANTANSTILYDPSTGIVSYDDDGNGAGAAVQLAQLNGGQTFVAGDFLFY